MALETAKVTSLSPGRGTLTNEYLNLPMILFDMPSYSAGKNIVAPFIV